MTDPAQGPSGRRFARTQSGPAEAALARIGRPVALTRAGMVTERLLRAFWPLGSLLFAAMAGLMFGLPGLLPQGVFAAVSGGIALAALGLLALGIRRMRWPSRAEAMARVDAALPGRPIAALSDSIALGTGDQGTQALWRAHLARMSVRAGQARAVPPAPALARRDPFALRLAAITALAMALLFGGSLRDGLTEVAQSTAGVVPAAVAGGPSWEGWAEPPRYTGRPGIYLNDARGERLELPAGSRISFRFYGPEGAITVEETVSAGTAEPAAAGAQSLAFEARQSGRISIGGDAANGERAFELVILPDAPPSVELLAEAERRADGRMSQPFRAQDDYAVTAGRATITLDLEAVDRSFGLATAPEPRLPLVLDLPLPIAGNRADFSEILVEDAARHAWANLPVTMILSVEDGRSQIGESLPRRMDLPGRRFFDPLGAALIEMRRDLLWSRENAADVSRILKAVSHRPEEGVTNQRVYLMLRAAIRQIDAALPAEGLIDEAVRDELAEALWEMALLLEDGGLSDALERMQQAQERLSEAIRNGASPDEIANLMAELKDATDNYLRQLAERALESGENMAEAPSGGQQITGDQIQEMMDEIQRLMEEGRMAEAQELLDQLSRMMENMQVAQGQGGGGDSPGNQAMRDLAETLRQQQGLSDEAFRELQEQMDGQGGQQGEGGQQGQGTGLADRQQQLRRELGRQQGLMPRTGGETGAEAQRRLEEAGRAMEGAEEALRDGDNSGALDRQAEAIDALREGMRSLGEALAEQQQQDGEGQAGQPGQPGEAYGQSGRGGDRVQPRDPLGRLAGEGGRIGTDEALGQGEDVYRRARDILDEIRRRSGERMRPEQELEYLRRLLDQF